MIRNVEQFVSKLTQVLYVSNQHVQFDTVYVSAQQRQRLIDSAQSFFFTNDSLE